MKDSNYSEIEYIEFFDEEDKAKTRRLFNAFFRQYPTITADEHDIPLGRGAIIDWACIWNKPSWIGMEVVPVAKYKGFVVVQTSLREVNIYRSEDLTPTKKKAMLISTDN